MIDIKLVREKPEFLKDGLKRRQMDPTVIDQLAQLDEKRRTLLTEVETLKAERNKVSKEISATKDAKEREAKVSAMREVGEKIARLDEDVKGVDEELNALIATIPNQPDTAVPFGKDETGNQMVRTVGEKKAFDFTPKPHWDLGPALGIIDFEQGVKITGSRFYVLNGAGARLQRALIAWMLDLHGRQGYKEKYTPFMVKGDTLFASG